MPPSGAAIPRRSRRKKLLGRAKSCRWQVFVRRRPPKQGELRTDVSKATMWGETRAAKGFNFVSAKPPLRRAESRFAEPRSSRKGNGLVLFAACKKYHKNTPRVATLWTPGDDSNLRSIRYFSLNNRRSSCNRPRRVLQGFRISTVRI